jgi:hypothetical protein
VGFERESGEWGRVQGWDAGTSSGSGIVATLKKTLDRFGNARQAGAAQAACVVRIVVGRKLREMGAEQPLQRAGTPLPVGAWRGGRKLAGQRIGHTLD